MSVRQAIGEPFKFYSLKAVRAAIDRFLKHVPINKLWSIVGDYQFKTANDTLINYYSLQKSEEKGKSWRSC